MSYITSKSLLRPMLGSIHHVPRICRDLESILCPNYVALDGALNHDGGSFGGRPCSGNYQTACFPWPERNLQGMDGSVQTGKRQKRGIGNSVMSEMGKPADGVALRFARDIFQGGSFASARSVWHGTNASTRGHKPNPFGTLGDTLIRCFSSNVSDDIPSITSTHSRTFKVEATYVGSNINVYDLLKLPIYSANFKAVHKGSALIGLDSKQKERDVQQVR